MIPLRDRLYGLGAAGGVNRLNRFHWLFPLAVCYVIESQTKYQFLDGSGLEATVWPKKKVVGSCPLSEGRSAALGRVSRNSTTSPRFDTRVRAATHSPVGATYCVRRDVYRKAGCPDTFGIVFASIRC